VTSQPDPPSALIDQWFPVGAVDEACGTPAGSGQNEKAIFTWFASRPIAQARAAVLCSLLPDGGDDDDETRELVEDALRTGNEVALRELSGRIPDVDGKRPVVLDCFSGRGIIPLEAARLGLRAVGTDLSPVAVLASRLLADWSLRDWSAEPAVPFERPDPETADSLFDERAGEAKLVKDLRSVLSEVGRRMQAAVAERYPTNEDGSRPWGYLWAITIPCDSCKARFPLIGSMVLRHPYTVTRDPGQALHLVADRETGTWSVEVHDGIPVMEPTHLAATGRKGKSARCPFCKHSHPVEAVKAKGFAGQYEDAVLAAADLVSVRVTTDKGRSRIVDRKVFRSLRPAEVEAALEPLPALEPFGSLDAIPDEQIAPGNKDSVRATGYGYVTWGSLMNDRQALMCAETVRAIRACHADLLQAGISSDYAAALASFCAANLVRRLRYSTKGARLRAVGKPTGVEQNRNKMGDLFANESAVGFAFDWFETGPAEGPGTWSSLSETTLAPLRAHLAGLSSLASPGRFRRASASHLPYRDASVDGVVCDPPYYSMIDYADVSDLFYVWLRRCLFDIVPDLFAEAGDDSGLQDKSQEIIVKRSPLGTDHRTTAWYEAQLSAAFGEMRRVLKPGGTLSVVFGHSDPDAWRRLLGALRDAGFVVTSAWPARTESANTGVASIKVTVTIGCRVASEGRRSATAAQVEREITELVFKRVKKWDDWNLALSDQLMASYGPAMQVVGRYRTIQRPDGTEPDLDHFLAVGRRAVADAHAFKVDDLPLDTFDPQTRFAIFWLRTFGRTTVNKGEAVFHAQSSQMKVEQLRPTVLEETKGGYALTLSPPSDVTEHSSAFDVVRALAAAWPQGASDAAGEVLAAANRNTDDAHVWATVAELVRRIPESDKVAMALTGCQRNRRAIEVAARHASGASHEQLTIDGDAS
jgi:adenine-specific DNA methylase